MKGMIQMKTSALILAAALVFGGAAYLPAQYNTSSVINVYADSVTEGAYTYSVNTDGTVRIEKYSGTAETVTIPSTLGDKKVTVLGEYSFTNLKGVKRVTIPDTVTTLEHHTFFNNKTIEYVDIPDSVKSIGSSCFWACTALKTISVPDSVTFFDSLVFERCTSLTEAKLPAGLTRIPGMTFRYCTSLTTVKIPDSVTKIDYCSFQECPSLKSLTIPKNAGIDDYAVGFVSEGSAFKPVSGFTMYVYEGSKGEEYAKNSELSYKYAGSEVQPAGKKGDINGDGEINVTDISMAAAHVKGKKSLSASQIEKADVNGDGSVTVTDISLISAHVKGIKKLI